MARRNLTSSPSRINYILNVTTVTNWLETNFFSVNQIRSGVDRCQLVNVSAIQLIEIKIEIKIKIKILLCLYKLKLVHIYLFHLPLQ